MRILVVIIALLSFVLPKQVDAQQLPVPNPQGVVKAYVNGQDVWAQGSISNCPPPFEQYNVCSIYLHLPNYWINALAIYEFTWMTCDPNGPTNEVRLMCIESYIRYAAYLHPFLDRFPGTYELKAPKPLPSCLIGYPCDAVQQIVQQRMQQMGQSNKGIGSK